MNNHNWMSDERIRTIEHNKIQFLQKLVFESNNLTEKEKMPFLLALASRSQKEHIKFSSNEINIIVDVIKDYATQEELQKIDKILRFFNEK